MVKDTKMSTELNQFWTQPNITWENYICLAYQRFFNPFDWEYQPLLSKLIFRGPIRGEKTNFLTLKEITASFVETFQHDKHLMQIAMKMLSKNIPDLIPDESQDNLLDKQYFFHGPPGNGKSALCDLIALRAIKNYQKYDGQVTYRDEDGQFKSEYVRNLHFKDGKEMNGKILWKELYFSCGQVLRPIVKKVTNAEVIALNKIIKWSEKEEETRDLYTDVPLLYIDDFAQGDIEKVCGEIFNIINARLEAGRPTLITCNKSPAELKSIFGQLSTSSDISATLSRLTKVHIIGQDQRKGVLA